MLQGFRAEAYPLKPFWSDIGLVANEIIDQGFKHTLHVHPLLGAEVSRHNLISCRCMRSLQV